MRAFAAGWLLSLCLCCALVLSVSHAQEPAPSARPTRLKVAFVESDGSPLGALLESELLQISDVDWVERKEVDKVLAEQKVQILFAPEAAADRARLGKILKADLLVFLRQADREKVPVADLAVSEVSRGLRLVSRSLPLSDNTANDVSQLRKLVAEGIGKQRSQIEAIYAIPPFLSKDLLHEHDGLRGAYARLVEQHFLVQPNVLVVELAEADALMKEAVLDEASSTLNRQLPFYFLGEYRNQGQGAERQVTVGLTLIQGSKILGSTSVALAADEVPAYLQRKVAAVLKSRAGRPTDPPDPALEAEQLLLRAEEHLRLGSWEDAVALAEASLLLDANRFAANVVAIKGLTRLLFKAWGYRIFELDEAQRAMAYYLRGLDHVAAFHRAGGQLQRYSTTGGGTFLDEFFSAASSLGVHPQTSAEVKDYMADVRRRNRAVLLSIYDHLVRTTSNPSLAYVSRGMPGLSEEEGFNLRKELILRYQDRPNAEHITFSLATFGYTANHLASPLGVKLLASLEQEGNATVKAQVAALRRAVEARFAQMEKERQILDQTTPLEEVPTGGERVQFEPLRFTWSAADGAKGELSSLDGYLDTSAGFDLAWAGGSIYVMRQPGKLERIFNANRPNCHFARPSEPRSYSGVCFDGQYVWGTLHQHGQPTRLLVLDIATGAAQELTSSHGLPDPNAGNDDVRTVAQTLSLAPIRPGRILLAGGFGRGWVGEAEFEPGRGGQVRIIQEAKDTPDRANKEQWRTNSIAFFPADIYALGGPPADEQTPVFLVNRVTSHVDAMYHPLIVDGPTLQVSVFNDKLYAQSDRLQRSPYEGAIYFVHGAPPAYRSLALFRVGLPGPKIEVLMQPPREGYCLATKDRIHIVGKQWWLVDWETKQATPAGPVPWIYSNRLGASGPAKAEVLNGDKQALSLLARSNHYGILAVYHGGAQRKTTIAKVSFTR